MDFWGMGKRCEGFGMDIHRYWLSMGHLVYKSVFIRKRRKHWDLQGCMRI